MKLQCAVSLERIDDSMGLDTARTEALCTEAIPEFQS